MRSLCRHDCPTLSERSKMYVVVDTCNESAHIDECCAYLAFGEVAFAYGYNDINSGCIIKIPCSQK